MRVRCGIVCLIASGAVAGTAAAGVLPTVPTPTVPTPTLPTPPPVPIPSVPIPTVPLPPAPVPTVRTPTVPAPIPPAPKPAPPKQPAPTGTTTAPSGGGAQPTSSGAAAGPTSSPSASSSSSTPAAHSRARAAAKSSHRRPVVAQFRVKRTVRVHVRVRELSPLCRRLGTFTYAAKAGANAVRLPKRIGSHRIGAGTYSIVGRTKAGRKLFAVVTQLDRRRTRLHARRLASAPECPHTESVSISSTLHAPGLIPPSTPPGASASGAPFKPPAIASSAPKHHSSSPLVRAVELTGAPQPLRPLLFALLAISIGLLAVAAVPQTVLPAGPAAAVIARRRGWIAAAGIWLLAVVALVAVIAS